MRKESLVYKMSDRFHRAARDGYLHVLKEATRRDCNHPDEDGLTPTSWAAYEGNIEALRLIVGRGGDPDKCDHYGNTALHCAAARGHMSCVSFLVNFGVNIWALDNDFHTAKDMAAMNNRDDILRYLDSIHAKQTMSDPKQVKKIQDKVQKDAEKRRKDFDKIQKKADKKREEENVKLQKEREKIDKDEEKPQGGGGGGGKGMKKSIMNTISRGSLAFIGGPRKDSTTLYSNNYQSPKFSDLTTSANSNKKTMGGMQKKIIRKKMLDENKGPNDFKVGTIESDGKKSVRNLKGLRRDSEIIFVPNGSLSSTNNGKRGKISDVFDQDSEDGGQLQRTLSQPDFFYDGDEQRSLQPRGSLFARPGFGSVAFRNSMTATLGSLAHGGIADTTSRSTPLEGSAGSLPYRNNAPEPWEEEDLPSDDESEATPVYLFLAAAGLHDFIPIFAREHVDLDALMLLTEDDMIKLSLPMGPRRKLLKAIAERKSAIEDPGEVEDSRL